MLLAGNLREWRLAMRVRFGRFFWKFHFFLRTAYSDSIYSIQCIDSLYTLHIHCVYTLYTVFTLFCLGSTPEVCRGGSEANWSGRLRRLPGGPSQSTWSDPLKMYTFRLGPSRPRALRYGAHNSASQFRVQRSNSQVPGRRARRDSVAYILHRPQGGVGRGVWVDRLSAGGRDLALSEPAGAFSRPADAIPGGGGRATTRPAIAASRGSVVGDTFPAKGPRPIPPHAPATTA
mmetsp:Transcript_27106/g.59944  ORF Transcript_27106/g.59944 Transcript_27106/m.59944 type:complete len:232 (-) Transcript_27106:109-804(-)